MRRRVSSLGAAAWLLAAAPLARAEGPSPRCTVGLVLGVSDAEARSVGEGLCRAARARPLPGILRVSVVDVGGAIAVSAALVDPSTGLERTARLRARGVGEAVRDAPGLVAELDPSPAPRGRAPSRPETPPAVTSPPAPPAPASAEAPRVTAAPVAPPPRPQASEAGPTTRVRIRSPSSVQLQRRREGRWETACMSPCGEALPVLGEYRVVDGRGTPLSSFQLSGRGETRIEVSPRSAALDALGGVGIAAGFVVFYAGLLANVDGGDDGAPAIAVGLGGMVAGAVGLFANRTTVRLTSVGGGASAQRAAPPRPLADLAPRRGLVAPLLSLSF